MRLTGIGGDPGADRDLSHTREPPTHVQIVLFDGFDPLDVIAPYEVLHIGGAASYGAVQAELVSAEGPRDVADRCPASGSDKVNPARPAASPRTAPVTTGPHPSTCANTCAASGRPALPVQPSATVDVTTSA